MSTTWSQVSGPGTTTFADAGAGHDRDVLRGRQLRAAPHRHRRRAERERHSHRDGGRRATRRDGHHARRALGTGADDVEESPSGSVNASSSDLELVADGSSVQTVGIRFRRSPCRAARRSSGRGCSSRPTRRRPPRRRCPSRCRTPTPRPRSQNCTARNVSSRPRTAAVAWAPASWPTVGARGADQRTPDLAVPLQRVVGRAGWASGNAVAVVVTGTGVRTAVAPSGATAGAPVLHVEYQP